MLFLLLLFHWSAIDYVGYATGQTDQFQGTGVFSGIKMEREPENAAEDNKAPKTTATAVAAQTGVSEKEPISK